MSKGRLWYGLILFTLGAYASVYNEGMFRFLVVMFLGTILLIIMDSWMEPTDE